jgi:MFS family permease
LSEFVLHATSNVVEVTRNTDVVVTDPQERERLQRRTLGVLVGGQIVGAAALGSSVTVGAFVVQEILGETTPWGGIATATSTIGTAFMAQMLARLMARKGRRAGLARGYLLATLGCAIAAVGVQLMFLPVFIAGLFLFGNGQAANLLARYAATDLATPTTRGSAMSRVVFASTFGAVFGPLLIGPAQWAGTEWFGLHKYAGPWLFSAVFLSLAALNTTLRLRPDPLVASGAVGATPAPRPPIRTVIALIWASPRGRLAVTAMIISQATMVGVMTMTPVHLKLHGHEGISAYVVSLHIAGMYAFSPLIGKFTDTYGRLQSILVAGVVLVASLAIAALSGDVEWLLFPSLWLLGVGWNFGLIGGSSLLVDSVPEKERVAVQGTADLLMSFCGGLAGFSSGFIRRAFGFHLLSTAALLAAGVLVVYGALWLMRTARPTDSPVGAR